MKIIETKPDVKVPGPAGDRVVNFKEFLKESLDLYQPIGKSRKMMRQANKIEDAIDAGNGTIKLEDADYDVLKAALHVDDDTADWNPVLRRLEREGWFDAVANAQDVKAAQDVKKE